MAAAPETQATQLREVELADVAPIANTGDKHICEVTLIRPGTSRNGNHYPLEVLRESQALFEGARAFTDHPAEGDRPERSIRDLVGYYRGVHLDETGKLRAQLHLVPGNEWLWNLIQESQAHAGLIGLSIDAWGDVTPENRPDGTRNRVNKLIQVDSVDIVTKPSAGGSFDRLLQSDRSRPTDDRLLQSDRSRPTDDRILGSDRTIHPSASGAAYPTAQHRKDGHVSTETQIRGTHPSDSEGRVPPASGSQTALAQHPAQAAGGSGALADISQLLESLQAEREESRRLQEELRREAQLARCEATLTSKLTEAQLPEVVSAKLKKRFAGTLFEPTTLEEAITEEKHVLAELSKLGQVVGNGLEKTVGLGMTELDKVQAAMDGLFGIFESEAARFVPRLSGIREAYQVCTGFDIASAAGMDRPLREALQTELRARAQLIKDKHASHLTESEMLLREADVTTSTFSFLLGTSMNKRLLADYQAWPSEWQKFSTVVAIKDFKTQDRIRLGAFGSLSTVNEDNAYTTLTLSDSHATYSATKRGNLVQITRETIINDDLYAIKQIPQKLAVAAAFTLAEFVYNLLAPNFGNIYDGHPLFDSVNHGNSAVAAANLNTTNSGNALTSANLQTAVVAMRKQTNAASKPIGLKPRYLLTCPDLEFTAMTILKSAGLPGGNNNDINPMLGYCEPIISPQLNSLSSGPASTHIWIAVADPQVIDTVEVGFVGGQANPVLLIQDMPLYGLNFTQDVVSYKVRHEYGGAVVDYRGFYLGNN